MPITNSVTVTLKWMVKTDHCTKSKIICYLNRHSLSSLDSFRHFPCFFCTSLCINMYRKLRKKIFEQSTMKTGSIHMSKNINHSEPALSAQANPGRKLWLLINVFHVDETVNHRIQVTVIVAPHERRHYIFIRF